MTVPTNWIVPPTIGLTAAETKAQLWSYLRKRAGQVEIYSDDFEAALRHVARRWPVEARGIEQTQK